MSEDYHTLEIVLSHLSHEELYRINQGLLNGSIADGDDLYTEIAESVPDSTQVAESANLDDSEGFAVHNFLDAYGHENLRAGFTAYLDNLVASRNVDSSSDAPDTDGQ